MFKRTACILTVLSLLTSCKSWFSNDAEDVTPFEGVPVTQLKKESNDALHKGEYESAAKRLEAMESLYPFDSEAEHSSLQLIYAYYKKEDYASAAASAERFIHLYPRSAYVDYAYYMKGLANFQQTRGSLIHVFPIDESYRDPGSQSQAYHDFAVLVKDFPHSRYRNDAIQRMVYLRNMFAKHELNVAQYYFDRKMYVAAIDRGQYVVTHYPQSPEAQSALKIISTSYRALGLNQGAEEADKLYKATYS